MPKAFIDIKNLGEEPVILESLLPEIHIPRAKVHLSHTYDTLRVEISTHDSVSLRAVCNSLLRWIDVAHQVQNLVIQCK
jgi:tRNA threonylcarbamoyladenosine modification (KEOPS) complex  Pcc1 subunit